MKDHNQQILETAKKNCTSFLQEIQVIKEMMIHKIMKSIT